MIFDITILIFVTVNLYQCGYMLVNSSLRRWVKVTDWLLYGAFIISGASSGQLEMERRQKRTIKVPVRYFSEDGDDNNLEEQKPLMERLDSADLNNRLKRKNSIPIPPDKKKLLASLGGEFLRAGFLEAEVKMSHFSHLQKNKFPRCCNQKEKLNVLTTHTRPVRGWVSCCNTPQNDKLVIQLSFRFSKKLTV